ncbi:MAG: hypothetical protein ACO1N0_16125 [Fluviicola sp.]
MTKQQEDKIVAQWISSTKDSVFISEDMLYYGVFDARKNGEIPNQEILNKLVSIPLSYLKVLEIDSKKKTSTLEYGKKSDLTILIRWENMDSLNEFKKFMIKLFPGSHTLFREDKVKFKTRGTIVALIVIPVIYVIALATDTSPSNGYSSSRTRLSGEAVINLFKALHSMGDFALTLLFGGLFGITLFRLFRTRKKITAITIIQLR